MRLIALVLFVVQTSWLCAEDLPREVKLTNEERILLELTNQEREKAKLPILKANPKLFEAARSHAANMARQGLLRHELDGKNVAERVEAAGYAYRSCGENIAFGQRFPLGAIQSWMKSEGHRENLLRKDFTEIGLGIASGPDGRPYYVQVFATPR